MHIKKLTVPFFIGATWVVSGSSAGLGCHDCTPLITQGTSNKVTRSVSDSLCHDGLAKKFASNHSEPHLLQKLISVYGDKSDEAILQQIQYLEKIRRGLYDRCDAEIKNLDELAETVIANQQEMVALTDTPRPITQDSPSSLPDDLAKLERIFENKCDPEVAWLHEKALDLKQLMHQLHEIDLECFMLRQVAKAQVINGDAVEQKPQVIRQGKSRKNVRFNANGNMIKTYRLSLDEHVDKLVAFRIGHEDLAKLENDPLKLRHLQAMKKLMALIPPLTGRAEFGLLLERKADEISNQSQSQSQETT